MAQRSKVSGKSIGTITWARFSPFPAGLLSFLSNEQGSKSTARFMSSVSPRRAKAYTERKRPPEKLSARRTRRIANHYVRRYVKITKINLPRQPRPLKNCRRKLCAMRRNFNFFFFFLFILISIHERSIVDSIDSSISLTKFNEVII